MDYGTKFSILRVAAENFKSYECSNAYQSNQPNQLVLTESDPGFFAVKEWLVSCGIDLSNDGGQKSFCNLLRVYISSKSVNTPESVTIIPMAFFDVWPLLTELSKELGKKRENASLDNTEKLANFEKKFKSFSALPSKSIPATLAYQEY
jgi:hypothetical protein